MREQRLPGVEIDGVTTSRRPLDAYYTPRAAVVPLLEELRPRLSTGETVLEPCCGNLDIVNSFRGDFHTKDLAWQTNDLDVRTPADTHRDACHSSFWYDLPRPEWVISNPPFSCAGDIVWQALNSATEGVAMLLRLSFLEAARGREWLTLRPPSKVIVLPRISFTPDGKTDSVTCAWMIWNQRWSDDRGVRCISRSAFAALKAQYPEVRA